MRDKLARTIRLHWHKAFVGCYASHMAVSAFEGSGIGSILSGLVGAMLVIGVTFHLDTED